MNSKYMNIKIKLDDNYRSAIHVHCIAHDMSINKFMETAAMYAIDLIKEGKKKQKDLKDGK